MQRYGSGHLSLIAQLQDAQSRLKVDCVPYVRRTACPAGTFSGSLASTCSACPANSTSVAGSSTCACDAGFFGTGSGATLTCTRTTAHSLLRSAFKRVRTHAGPCVYAPTRRRAPQSAPPASCSLPEQHVRRRRGYPQRVHGMPGRKHERRRVDDVRLQLWLRDLGRWRHPRLHRFVSQCRAPALLANTH